MEDWWEIQYILDINNPADATGNLDGDAYDNLTEFNNGTDPTVFNP